MQSTSTHGARQTHTIPITAAPPLAFAHIWTFFMTTENNNNRSFYSRFGIIFSLFTELILLLLPLAHKADTNHKLYGQRKAQKNEHKWLKFIAKCARTHTHTRDRMELHMNMNETYYQISIFVGDGQRYWCR